MARSFLSGGALGKLDVEAALPLRLLDVLLDRIDAGASRPAAAPDDHGLHPLGRAFEDGLDRSVGAIPYPPDDPERPRTRRRLLAEADALDSAADDDAYTQALSGRGSPPRR
jgi:hypothetical protein